MGKQDLVISGFLVIAAAMDVKARRIPNWWTGLFFLVGCIVAFVKKEVGAYIGFSITAFLISSFGFWIGAVGGADVKLIGALAGWVRSWEIYLCVFIALVIAACVGITQMMIQRKFCSRMVSAVQYLMQFLLRKNGSWREHLPDTKPIRFSICILIGYWLMRLGNFNW